MKKKTGGRRGRGSAPLLTKELVDFVARGSAAQEAVDKATRAVGFDLQTISIEIADAATALRVRVNDQLVLDMDLAELRRWMSRK